MTFTTLSEARCFNGTQRVLQHDAVTLNSTMRLGVYQPDGDGPFPALFWLSGLTCTEENFISKAGAQRMASDLGVILIAPDTSPRGEDVPDDPEGAYDFGLGAGFYVNATQAPWSKHYQMRSYVEVELYDACLAALPIDAHHIGITGHSMGGHGALTIGLRNPDKFQSISAFAPICAPMDCPWGDKALSMYLGSDKDQWREYDACQLIDDGARVPAILVDQGMQDNFLTQQLKPERLEAACSEANIPLEVRYQPGFDHSYYFISTFISDHLAWHHNRGAFP